MSLRVSRSPAQGRADSLPKLAGGGPSSRFAPAAAASRKAGTPMPPGPHRTQLSLQRQGWAQEPAPAEEEPDGEGSIKAVRPGGWPASGALAADAAGAQHWGTAPAALAAQKPRSPAAAGLAAAEGSDGGGAERQLQASYSEWSLCMHTARQ